MNKVFEIFAFIASLSKLFSSVAFAYNYSLQNEIATQKSLLTILLLGQTQGLLEGVQDPLLDLRGQAGVADVAHAYMEPERCPKSLTARMLANRQSCIQ